MAKKRIKPSRVNFKREGIDVCVGEFHYGSASDSKVLPPGKGIKLFLTDPPYNLGFDYGEVSDNQPEEDYHDMMEDVFDSCYEAADDDAHLFIIHYPQDIAKMWPRLTKKWKFHQWINWNYPANFGHSTKKWTNASRTILWLVKGNPDFYGERVVQPYRNPTDRRIKKLIHEEGKIGITAKVAGNGKMQTYSGNFSYTKVGSRLELEASSRDSIPTKVTVEEFKNYFRVKG